MIKPSYKSLEGQSLGGVLLGGLFLLYEVLSDGNAKLPPAEDLINYANSAKEMADAIRASGTLDVASLSNMGKTGLILVFMYKMYDKFVDARTELKKKALEK